MNESYEDALINAEIKAQEHLEKLYPFVFEMVVAGWEGMSMDAADLQDLALKHEILVEVEREVPCGPHCGCADIVEAGKTVTCYKVHDGLLDLFQLWEEKR